MNKGIWDFLVMKKKWILSGLISALVFTTFPVARAQLVGQQALDTSQVVTSGTPVVAAKGGTVFRGCWIMNDPNSSTNIIVDDINVANHTTPAPTAVILQPGQTYVCPGGQMNDITIDSFDNAHKFYGRKW